MARSTEVTKEQVMRSLVEDKMMVRVVNMITDAIAYSFAVAPCRMTRTEIRGRFQRAFKIWKELRAEMSYPLVRLEECLGQYLVLDIEGHQWNPLKRRTWLPGDPVSKRMRALPHAQLVAQQPGTRHIRHELSAAGFTRRAR